MLHASTAARIHTYLAEHPLERPNPAAELVFRDHEDLEIGRAPLQQLTAELFEAILNRFLVSHAPGLRNLEVVPSTGGIGESGRGRPVSRARHPVAPSTVRPAAYST